MATTQGNIPALAVGRLTDLLDAFGNVARPPDQESLDARRQLICLRDLLAGFAGQIEKWRTSQKAAADDFNLFDVLAVAEDEVRHSTLLGWLLDWRIETGGTHAQGNLGFRLLLKKLQLPDKYAEKDYWVRREVSGEQSRVDLEIAAPGDFIIHVENKLWSAEGSDQTQREWADLRKRARSLAIPETRVHAIFLTMLGDRAEAPGFQPCSWLDMADLFEDFACAAEPPEVKLFAAHCARALRSSCANRARTERRSEDGDKAI